MTFDVGTDNERERRIVRTACPENLETLCDSPRLIHVGAVGVDRVGLNREVETSRRDPCEVDARLARRQELVPRARFEEQSARDDQHEMPWWL